MHIHIFIHPNERNMFWAKRTQKAISAEILRRRFTADYIHAASVWEIDFDKVFAKEEKRVLLYIGIQKPTEIDYLTAHDVHTVLVNNDFADYSATHSRVLINYRSALNKAMSYLLANGRDRVALYAVNLASATDRIMEARFSEILRANGEEPSRDIYYNSTYISECYARFAPYRSAYNAVICANDISAVDLQRRLTAEGVRIPEDMFILSCSPSSVLVEQNGTSITTISASREEIGMQAVYIYSLLVRNPSVITLSAHIEPMLIPRASTAFAPEPENPQLFCYYSPHVAAKFYEDPVTQSFFSVENLLLHQDDLDRAILDGLFAGESYSTIAERTYTTANMITYRIKRMCRLTGCANREALLALITPYLK